MFIIIKNQLINGLTDARFVFMFVIVILAFLCNGLIYSENYRLAEEDRERGIRSTSDILSSRSSNLQEVAVYFQQMTKPLSALSFVADGQNDKLPNTISVNAFYFGRGDSINRSNPRFPILPILIGFLLSDL